jgi:hypothetical protein
MSGSHSIAAATHPRGDRRPRPCVVVWRLMESAFGDQSLREIVGELQARHETAPAARASSRPQPAQRPDAAAGEELPRVVGEAGRGDRPVRLRVAPRPWWPLPRPPTRPDRSAHHATRSETCSLSPVPSCGQSRCLHDRVSIRPNSRLILTAASGRLTPLSIFRSILDQLGYLAAWRQGPPWYQCA